MINISWQNYASFHMIFFADRLLFESTLLFLIITHWIFSNKMLALIIILDFKYLIFYSKNIEH
jgi:hypothetical protein